MPIRKIGDAKYMKKECRHPDHMPPKYISLPAGVYEHECPACGEKHPISVMDVTC